MISRGLILLTLLSTLQAMQVSIVPQLSNSATSLLSLKEDSTLVEVPLIIDCGDWDCSVTTVDGYTAEIVDIVENTIYITVTDEDETDVNDDAEKVITATVTCSDSDDCPLESYDTVDIIVTLPDGSILELNGIDIEMGDL